jgi:hypothetical protein
MDARKLPEGYATQQNWSELQRVAAGFDMMQCLIGSFEAMRSTDERGTKVMTCHCVK